ncbi:MAG: hypothetical protein KA792_05860 [Bacteroidales bacterium]|nr:hypothetical protein [Bacteroidales bacterium]
MPDFIKLPYNLRQKPDREKLQNFISDFLVNNNFYELFCNSLCKASFNKPETNIKLMNPLSKELDSLRQSLLYNGLEAIAYNINHKKKDLKLFEFGKVYKLNSDSETPNKYHEQFILALYITGKKYKENWRLTNWDIDIYDLKETVTSLLLKLNFIADDIKFEEFSKKDCFSYGHNIFIKNILIGEIGSLNSKSLKIFDISNTIIYANLDWDKLIYLCNNVIITEELPKYPEVKRDLALMLNENINYSDIEIVIKKLNNPLIKSFSLFDYFTGGDIPQGKKSYALRFILQDKEKTMTDKGIDKILTEIKNTIRLNLKGEIR